MPWVPREWVPAAQAPLHWFSHSVLSGWSRLMPQLNPGTFLFGFLFSWSFSFTCFRKLSWLLRVLYMLNMYLTLLARILSLFVSNNAHRMLGDNVDSSSFAVGTSVGHSFWTVPVPLMPTTSPFLWIRMYVAEGATPCFLKGLSSSPLCQSFWRITGRW